MVFNKYDSIPQKDGTSKSVKTRFLNYKILHVVSFLKLRVDSPFLLKTFVLFCNIFYGFF